MSSKRIAALLAKDPNGFVLSKNNQKNFYSSSTETQNDQYKNINLNQIHKNENVKVLHSEKKPHFIKRKDIGFIADKNNHLSTKRNACVQWNKNDISKLNESFKNQKMIEKGNKWQNKTDKSCKNSIFSLHISVYENSNEKEKDTFAILKNVRSSVKSKMLKSQISHDFLKQQNQKFLIPEVMNFKASQKFFKFSEFRLKDMQSIRHASTNLSQDGKVPEPKEITPQNAQFDEVTHTGQAWDQGDYRLARNENNPKTINPNIAAHLIAEIPPKPVEECIVSCEGGEIPALGHPLVYINLDKPGTHACGYCGQRFYNSHVTKEKDLSIHHIEC